MTSGDYYKILYKILSLVAYFAFKIFFNDIEKGEMFLHTMLSEFSI